MRKQAASSLQFIMSAFVISRFSAVSFVHFQLTMMADSKSVHEQITRLCQKILKQHTTTHPLEHCSSSVIVKQLRAIAYGILLNKSHTSCK